MSITQNLKSMVGLSEPIRTTSDLFIHGLKDIYYAEKQLVDALENMAGKAKSAELKTMFTNHRQETITHVERLERIFGLMDIEAEDQTCPAINGLIEEAKEILAEAEDHMVDQGLVFAAQGVEHYEMARYTGLLALAQQLEMADVMDILMETLMEEAGAAEGLTEYAGITLQTGTFSSDSPRRASSRAN